jgi:hypothetical protein
MFAPDLRKTLYVSDRVLFEFYSHAGAVCWSRFLKYVQCSIPVSRCKEKNYKAEYMTLRLSILGYVYWLEHHMSNI